MRTSTQEKHNHVHLERPLQQVFVRKQDQRLHKTLLQKDEHFTQVRCVNNKKHWNVRLELALIHI